MSADLATARLLPAPQRWMVLEPGVVLGVVPPCGTGVLFAPPMPGGVLPSVPGIAPVGLSSPGAGVDSVGRGGSVEGVGSSVGLADGGVAGVSPPPDPVVPGVPMPGAGDAPVLPAPTPPPVPPVV